MLIQSPRRIKPDQASESLSVKHVTSCVAPVTMGVNEDICWWEHVQEEWEALL